jgi:predicted RNase H-like HicB family nuclease
MSGKRKTEKKGAAMRFVITIEQDEDGMFIAECPAIPGCISQGRTEKEALENINDAIRQCLEVRGKRGMPLTIATREIEVPV